jgi:hypothetical protein
MLLTFQKSRYRTTEDDGSAATAGQLLSNSAFATV